MRTATIALACIALVSCSDSSTSPTRGTLAVSEPNVTIGRNASTQLSATFTPSSGASRDVTATASWRSSNPVVATVTAGRIAAAGIGTAVITAEHQGQSATVSVVARRNTRVAGQVTVTDASNRASLLYLGVYLDGEIIGGLGYSGARGTATTTFGIRPVEIANMPLAVTPGRHDLAAKIQEVQFWVPPFEGPWVSGEDSVVQIIDSDTGEQLTSLPLPRQQIRLSPDMETSWPLDVPVFDR